ncbi:MAG TPA: DsbA family oxidoreductase [Acidimicrobiales bacterium]|nr:DsbA family oxidoreductase [Acidimicrobiales bacterium]
MKVEVWSDVVCPWCYIGKRHLEAALGRFEHRDDVEVTWRAFELDPAGPVEREGAYTDRLATKYRIPVAEAEAMVERMTRVGDDVGVDMRFDRARPGNTFDAHRIIHLGLERGVQDAVKERLLAATFTEGRPIGRPETLVELAVEAGLDEDEARSVLAGDRFAAEVRAEEELARALGITSVPFFVIDRTHGVPGAQHPDVLLDLLRQVWAEVWAESDTAPATASADSDQACAGDACPV